MSALTKEFSQVINGLVEHGDIADISKKYKIKYRDVYKALNGETVRDIVIKYVQEFYMERIEFLKAQIELAKSFNEVISSYEQIKKVDEPNISTCNWVMVTGYDYEYMVSDTGSIVYNRKDRNGNIVPKSVKQYHSKIGYGSGYMTCSLKKDNKRFSVYVHRIVAKAFVPNPHNKSQVNHINGNGLDNRAENLEWVTPQENIHHAINNGMKGSQPTTNACVITKDICKSVIDMRKIGMSKRAIKESTGVTSYMISQILSGKAIPSDAISKSKKVTAKYLTK